MLLGAVIEEILTRSDKKQIGIAKILKCTQATLSRLKNSKQYPTMKLAKRIYILAKKYKIKCKMEDMLNNGE